jgi:hypothetical protein
MAQLSEWLQLMLAEIARKQEDAQRASEEQEQAQQAAPSQTSSLPPEYLSTPN